MNLVKPSVVVMAAVIQFASPVFAETNSDEQLQDMSDPLAVYTQAGFGITDKGANIKIGQTYKSVTTRHDGNECYRSQRYWWRTVWHSRRR